MVVVRVDSRALGNNKQMQTKIVRILFGTGGAAHSAIVQTLR